MAKAATTTVCPLRSGDGRRFLTTSPSQADRSTERNAREDGDPMNGRTGSKSRGPGEDRTVEGVNGEVPLKERQVCVGGQLEDGLRGEIQNERKVNFAP